MNDMNRDSGQISTFCPNHHSESHILTNFVVFDCLKTEKIWSVPLWGDEKIEVTNDRVRDNQSSTVYEFHNSEKRTEIKLKHLEITNKNSRH